MEALVIIIIIGILWFALSFYNTNYELKNCTQTLIEKNNKITELRQSLNIIKNKNHDLHTEKNTILSILEEKESLYKKLAGDFDSGVRNLAELVADYKTIQYEISAKYLEEKKHPANVEAMRIRELSAKTKEIIQKNRIMEYKYEYLFKLFPDLELYVDDLNIIKALGEHKNLSDVAKNMDRTRYYLNKNEWSVMEIDERNQLALNRYIEGRKSKWQIGRDYEMFIGYEYAVAGWDVDYCGIEKQLEDMGRDLIAKKDGITHIIQCKYWSQSKTIHEKHIAQLYGTTVQYILSENDKNKVMPVIITNIRLSELANNFAEYLNVKVIDSKKLLEFPRIKCNINKDTFGSETHIYHLPMDQQYDKTKICNEGEFYAHTVKEAVSKGFRRAKRYFGEG